MKFKLGPTKQYRSDKQKHFCYECFLRVLFWSTLLIIGVPLASDMFEIAVKRHRVLSKLFGFPILLENQNVATG